jgi:hypothetical protein
MSAGAAGSSLDQGCRAGQAIMFGAARMAESSGELSKFAHFSLRASTDEKSFGQVRRASGQRRLDPASRQVIRLGGEQAPPCAIGRFVSSVQVHHWFACSGLEPPGTTVIRGRRTHACRAGGPAWDDISSPFGAGPKLV